jgi:flavin-dependent dehydrogenase
VRHTRFTYADDHIDISIKPSHGVDALYAPRRRLLDPTLAQAAADAGADIRYRMAVTELIRHRERVVGVRARAADGRVEDVTADLVIGADGINSTVAKLTGAGVRRHGQHATAATYGYWSDLDTNGYEWVFRADACSGVIPTNDEQVCVFASARPERIGRGGLDVIRQLVSEGDPELAERLARAAPPTGTRTWGGHLGYIRQSHGPGWALVGDAAYFKDPIGAHGLTDALRDAELLARAVIHGIGDDATTAAALADYQRTRDRLSIPLFDTVDRIASNDWDDTQISDLLRQLSSSMADEVETLAALDLERVA